MWSMTAERFTESLPDKLELQYGDAAEMRSSQNGKAVILATYGVRLKEEGGENQLAVLEVTLRAVYDVPECMDDALFEQFRAVTLRIHTVAFAREWFRDASARMGLSPIILPMELVHPAAVRKPRRSSSSGKSRTE